MSTHERSVNPDLLAAAEDSLPYRTRKSNHRFPRTRKYFRTRTADSEYGGAVINRLLARKEPDNRVNLLALEVLRLMRVQPCPDAVAYSHEQQLEVAQTIAEAQAEFLTAGNHIPYDM